MDVTIWSSSCYDWFADKTHVYKNNTTTTTYYRGRSLDVSMTTYLGDPDPVPKVSKSALLISPL